MVNAKHARPLAAFWLLALAAALITGLGLVGDRQGVQARHGTPVRVPSSAAPELVLGDVLHSQPNRTFTSPLSPDLWTPQATAAPAGGSVQVSTPSAAATAPKARTKSGGGQHTTTVRTHSSQTTTATAAAATPTKGHGKGRNKSDDLAKTTTTATATATATASPNKPGHGKGGGHTDNPGKGH